MNSKKERIIREIMDILAKNEVSFGEWERLRFEIGDETKNSPAKNGRIIC